MNLFPSGLASGQAFCNRITERAQLKRYIEQNQHVVLMAPRRYGKSSLIQKVLEDNHYIYVWIDFLSVTEESDVLAKIQYASKELLLHLAPELKKLQLQTSQKLKALAPELNLGVLGQSLTLNLHSNPDASIDKLLLELDQFAAKYQKKAVIVMDEFQQLSELKLSQKLEALIRHAVERATSIIYIFSGSNRHLLKEMFSDSKRPLYKLCSVMPLHRIHHDDYAKFIQSVSKKHWGKPLNNDIIDLIVLLSERHPYYINALCREVFSQSKIIKSTEELMILWKNYTLNNKILIINDVIPLALNQKKIIKALAIEPELQPFGLSFSSRTKLSTASIRRALEGLLLKDIVIQSDNNQYQLMDPALSYYFKHIY